MALIFPFYIFCKALYLSIYYALQEVRALTRFSPQTGSAGVLVLPALLSLRHRIWLMKAHKQPWNQQ